MNIVCDCERGMRSKMGQETPGAQSRRPRCSAPLIASAPARRPAPPLELPVD